MKKIAVVLSGCGHEDGSEITEAVSSLIALGQENATYVCFAPQDRLAESARIARGNIRDVSELVESEFDALLFPGGFGAVLHLCDWSQKGARCTVLPAVEAAVLAFFRASKPIGAICIAPTILARVLGSQHITLTIGNDRETALEIEKTGAVHEECPVDDYISDRNNKVLTTPAYMYESQPHLVFKGISKMVKELVEMA